MGGRVASEVPRTSPAVYEALLRVDDVCDALARRHDELHAAYPVHWRSLMHSALINRSQYATTTDLVLAIGKITKSNGPHTAFRGYVPAPECVEPAVPDCIERTVYMRSKPRGSVMRALLLALALLTTGAVAGSHLAHASHVSAASPR